MKFKVGDLAITQNSIVPEWNNRLLVIVVTATMGYETPLGSVDYQIRRVDGQPFGWTTGFNGEEKFFKQRLCWCKESNLIKPEDADLQEESEIQRHLPDEFEIQAAKSYEEAIRTLSLVEVQSTPCKVIPHE